jgi:lipoprotein-releasing system permease protein
MYKLLLCGRYLRTRYIALASIISVMLGVATMIVVNSVMAGFTREMQNRIHGILSDLSFEAHSLDGFPDAEWHKEQIRRVAGDCIEGMTATVAVPAMLNFRCRDNWITRPVELIGIDEGTQSSVSDFSRYLQHPENRRQMSFLLREDGYDTRDHQAGTVAPPRPQMAEAGWVHRRRMADARAFEAKLFREEKQPRPAASGRLEDAVSPPAAAAADQSSAASPEAAAASTSAVPATDPFAQRTRPVEFDPAKQQRVGAVPGIALVSVRTHQGEDFFLALPGDEVQLTFPNTLCVPPKAVSDDFTIVDLYESKMSEYDQKFVFVPIRRLQELRGMIDPSTGIGMVSSIQIKLRPGVDGEEVRDRLRAKFAPEIYGIYTWRDKQGPLLAAVQMETAILNVLLFLIIAVAGFGILAIFYMIVVEKTRDIGILKSLGAPRGGVMGIFLGYGLSLGLVGSGVGLVLGLLFVRYINQIADLLGWITGRPVFDPAIYYFYSIPTMVEPQTIAGIVGGAVGIAVAASILPARRAARLHPVEALRYE